MHRCEQTDVKRLVHCVQVVIVHQRLKALGRRREGERAQDDDGHEGAEHLDAGPAKRGFETRGTVG